MFLAKNDVQHPDRYGAVWLERLNGGWDEVPIEASHVLKLLCAGSHRHGRVHVDSSRSPPAWPCDDRGVLGFWVRRRYTESSQICFFPLIAQVITANSQSRLSTVAAKKCAMDE